MRRRRPWWAVLTASALVMASLLAPMEGAAYRIENPGTEPPPVDRGDPDNPGSGRSEDNSKTQFVGTVSTVFYWHLVPGVIITVRMNLPASVFPRSSRTTK